MKSLYLILVAACLTALVSCSSMSSKELVLIKTEARQQLTIVKSPTLNPQFRSISPIASKSKTYGIKGVKSFESILCKRLREKGYNAKVSDKPEGVANIVIKPVVPPTNALQHGSGLYQHKVAGQYSQLEAHCNLSTSLVNTNTNASTTFYMPYNPKRTQIRGDIKCLHDLSYRDRIKALSTLQSLYNETATNVIHKFNL